MNYPRAVSRAVRSELTKLSLRSPVVYAMIPLAVVIPVLLNGVLAQATRRDLISGGGIIETTNSAYWMIVFTTLILMLAAVSVSCNEFGFRSVNTSLAIQPRRTVLPIAKLATFGGVGFVVSLVTTAGVLIGFRYLFFTDVWGPVNAFTGDWWRVVIGVPVMTFFICALGVGVSFLVQKTGLVVMIILLWRFGIENFFTFVRGDAGLMLQRLAPFKNAEIGAGQPGTIESLFGGPTGSLCYFAVVGTAVFVLGILRFTRTDVSA